MAARQPIPRPRWRVASGVLLALVLGCLGPGCGGGADGNGGVTITVASRDYPEEEVLREIYAHALEAAGFEVKRRDDPGLLPRDELDRGQISGYPDHLEAALTEWTPLKLEEVPDSTAAAYKEARKRLGEKGLVPFPPTSYVRTNAIGVLKTTAEKDDLKSISDLKREAGRMNVIESEQYCKERAPCLNVIEHNYGIGFEGYSPVEPVANVYKTLRAGETDGAILITTDGRLTRNKSWLVVLEDDRHRFPAANAFWLTRQAVVEEAGPDYEKAILAAQKGLSLKVMRELDAAVELAGKSPGEVAEQYLKSIQFGV
jgi:glycine betaine/choline ABC-type transport system substrate-binding protein